MKFLKNTMALALLSIALGGCVGMGLPGQLGNILKAATTTIANPVDGVDIYRVKNTYAAAGELVAEWRRYCWSSSYGVLMKDPIARPVCSGRRETLRIIQSADNNAFAAIAAADRFVAENQTLNISSAISAAWKAVATFQSSIPVKKGTL